MEILHFPIVLAVVLCLMIKVQILLEKYILHAQKCTIKVCDVYINYEHLKEQKSE